MSFTPAASPHTNQPHAYLVCVTAGGLLAQRQQVWRPLRNDELGPLATRISQSHYLGAYHGQPCHVVYMGRVEKELVAHLGLEEVSLRSQLGEISDELFQLAGRGLQVVNWCNYHRFCGRCGTATRPDREDRATVCDKCDVRYYPRLSPCVIVLIEKGEHCLLAHNTRSRTPKYSALAGFIEPGETVEEALAREVHEEVGLTVQNTRYFSSQPWPFPGQLMLGFHADYEDGDILVDGVEIDDAQWFHANQLPLTPAVTTISGRLIQDFVQRTYRA